MRTKLTQSIPLLATFLALVVGGVILFNLSPADALLEVDAQTTEPPVDTISEYVPVDDSDTPVITAATDSEDTARTSTTETTANNDWDMRWTIGLVAGGATLLILAILLLQRKHGRNL